MSQERFDDLAKTLATNELSRAQILKLAGGAFLGSVLGGFGLTVGTDEAEAKKGGRKKKKKKKRHTSPLPVSSGPCTQLNLDANGNATPSGACQDPSTTTSLSSQASTNAHYSLLASYLTDNGFVANGGSASGVFTKDGTLQRSLLASAYFNSGSPNEIAGLYYDVEATGSAVPFAAVWDTQQKTLLYMLFSDGTGKVLTWEASAVSRPAITSSKLQISPTDFSGTCNSTQLQGCIALISLTVASAVAEFCSAPCVIGTVGAIETVGISEAPCLICLGKAGIGGLIGIGGCAQTGGGCGAFTTSFCSNNVCCGLTETGCGGNSCCTSAQQCCRGTCIDEQQNCDCRGTVEDCSSSSECCDQAACCNGICCPPGFTCCSGDCVDLNTDSANCDFCGRSCGDNICVNGVCRCNPNDNDGPDGDNDCDDGVFPNP